MHTSSTKSRSSLFFLLIVVIIALWFRWPSIETRLPYITDEDEGHHFNRVVEMVKTGDWNPHYFLKPTLHFYLRVPVTALSFLWEVKKGRARTVQEIQTRNPFGLAGYSYTASHPGMVKWNRFFSLLFGLATIGIVYHLILRLTASSLSAFVGALLLAIAPPLVTASSTIGVDPIASFFVILTTFFSYRACKKHSLKELLLASLVAGLAISSKYNVAPIALVPLVALFLSHRGTVLSIFFSATAIAIGFLLGTPYCLISFPLFLNHLAYEIWHYGIAGHIGHEGAPGWGQLWFYLTWLRTEGIGLPAFIVALLGIMALLRGNRRSWILVLFPLLYLTLMSTQRANFIRNMYVMLPFLAIAVGYGVGIIKKRFPRKSVALIFSFFILALPLWNAFAIRRAVASAQDSRDALLLWLHQNKAEKEIAIDGTLQLPRSEITSLRSSSIDPKKISTSSLWLSGFDLSIDASGGETNEKLPTLKYFPGTFPLDRVPANPGIRVLDLSSLKGTIDTTNLRHLAFQPSEHNTWIPQDLTSSEPYLWTQERLTFIELPIPVIVSRLEKVQLTISAMSPWKNQSLFLAGESVECDQEFQEGRMGSCKVSLSKEKLLGNNGLILESTQVHSPKIMGLNDDPRRLGVALKQIRMHQE